MKKEKIISFEQLLEAVNKDWAANAAMGAIDVEDGTVTAGSYVITQFMEPEEVPDWLSEELSEMEVLPENAKAVVIRSYNSGFSGNGKEAQKVGYTLLDGHVVPVVIYWEDLGIVAGSTEHVETLFE